MNSLGLVTVALLLVLHPVDVRGQARAEYLEAMRASEGELQNDRVLASWMDHIFVGQVLREAPANRGQIQPLGHDGQPLISGWFEVEVLSNIKGRLEGQIIVHQLAGVRDGILYFSDGNVMNSVRLEQAQSRRITAPLQPGATYLFATRLETNTTWQRARPEQASIQLLLPPATNREELIDSVLKDPRVQKLQTIQKELEALFAEPADAATAAVDKWLRAYGHELSLSDLPQAQRELDRLLEQVGETAALVVALRVEKQDPRVLGTPGAMNGATMILDRLGSRAAPAVPILGRTLRAIRHGPAQDLPAYNYVIGLLLKTGSAGRALEEIIQSIPGTNTFHWYNYSVPSLLFLSKTGTANAQARLEPFLRHEDYFVRLAAAVTIAEVFGIGGATTSIIEEALASPDQALSGMTTLRIGQFKGDRTVLFPAMLRNATNNAIVSQTLGRLGTESLPVIVQMFEDKVLPMRQQGVNALRTYLQSGNIDPNEWPILAPTIASIAEHAPRLALEILARYPAQAKFGYVDLLERLAQSPDRSVSDSAKELLERLDSILPAIP